jgi:two-component system LytT family response regulator
LVHPIFRAVLCDDNPDDQEHFRHLLKRHPSLELVGIASTFAEALERVIRENADVLFLESTLQGTSVLANCSLVPPTVKMIFVTNDASSAVRAFELDAVDYLLKPVVSARLSETVRRLLRIDWQRPKAAPESGTVLIPFERGRRGVSLDSMTVIQAFGNYTRVSFDESASEIVLRSLAKWEDLLPCPPFLRVHRNTLVNTNKVSGLESTSQGAVLQVRGFDEPLTVSRRCLARVRESLFHSNAS